MGASIVVGPSVVGVAMVDATGCAVETERSPAVLEQAVVTKAMRTMRKTKSRCIVQIVSLVEIGAETPFIRGSPRGSFSPTFDLEGRCRAAMLDFSSRW